MIWIRRILAVFLTLVSLVTLGMYWFAHKQGRLSADYTLLGNTQVAWDGEGVPTITAPSWEKLVEAQGFVVASERLFQMDLMRRSGAGRLAEWFGGHPSAIEWDRSRRLEDWQGVADAAAEKMQGDDRQWCEAYARGVNKFIESLPWRWGIEYVVLADRPEPWKCSDSVLVLLSLVDDLTRSAEIEAWATVWKQHLPKDWFDFLFPHDHPWNEPLFGRNERRLAAPKQKLPTTDIDDKLVADPLPPDAYFPGSNSWFWAGKTGAFLANDPHLGMTVPQIWFALRLRISAEEWAVGASVPGLPGIILGRNSHLSWAFTNAMEDVDDLLEEELTDDGKNYVAAITPSGQKQLRPVREKEFSIAVRGDAPVTGTARFTHRGPLLKYSVLGSDKWFSRQWVGFHPDRLTLPVASMNRARDWKELNAAADRFLSPSQSILVADNAGNVGYRMSGSGIKKQGSSLVAVPALSGEWRGFEISSRKQKRVARGAGSPIILSTANQRIYTDANGHHWSSDVRQERIQRVLKSSDSHTAESMQKLQLDTSSRYLKMFSEWLVRNNQSTEPGIVRVREMLSKWDGVGKSDAEAFFLAVEAHRVYTRVLMAQIRSHLLPKAAREITYSWKNQNAWLVYLLENPKALESFGLNPAMLAHFALKKIAAIPPSSKGYPDANRWQAQHPMASAVPLLGTWMKLDELPQWGFEGLVRVERERSGASLRVVWNIDEPLKSSWVFPVGQSGHVASSHYKSFRQHWFGEKQVNVFDPAFEWKFAR